MAALERKIVDSKMKEMGDPINVIRDLVDYTKYSESSLKRMMQYILMKHPNSLGRPKNTRKAKKNTVIKPVGGTVPKPEKPTPEKAKKSTTRRGFLQRLMD
jgi:hypothetical protein